MPIIQLRIEKAFYENCNYLTLTEHIESIRNYPTPINLTYMRSFFALVEQVAPFVMVKPYLHPFRELLKKDRKFY